MGASMNSSAAKNRGTPRRRMTVRFSPDDGANWPERLAIRLDDGISAGYSCLTVIDDTTLGILYESSRAHLVFQRLPIPQR